MTTDELQDLKELSELIINLNDQRERALEVEDYDKSFEIECDQREAALNLADIILLTLKGK